MTNSKFPLHISINDRLSPQIVQMPNSDKLEAVAEAFELNAEQKRAYYLFCGHRYIRHSIIRQQIWTVRPSQLLLGVASEGGTGKSRLI